MRTAREFTLSDWNLLEDFIEGKRIEDIALTLCVTNKTIYNRLSKITEIITLSTKE